MNRRGFTLVELLATLVLLGIVMSIVVVVVHEGFGNAKDKTEEVFIDTVEDALGMYLDGDRLDSNGNRLSFGSSSVCTINKTHGSVKVYKATNEVTMKTVIDSKYKPISQEDLVNPANEEVECANASNIKISIYRDEDMIYYYKIDKSDFVCLNTTGEITSLPSGCVE